MRKKNKVLKIKRNQFEDLRAERLKREHEEKLKTQSLLKWSSTIDSSIQIDDRKIRFTSQFNHDLARF